MTPFTKNKKLMEQAEEEVGKLSPLATGFTLFKGFVASGILYLPTNFTTGGSLFSAGALVFALLLTLFCIKLLLEVRAACGGNMSFPELGYACYGRPGRILVDISLFASQFGFVCAYIYFIASQTTDVLTSAFGWNIPLEAKWYYAPICFAILFPLCLVRKIQTFAKFHLFGDIMVLLTVVVCIVYSSISVANNGWLDKDLPLFNNKEWPNCIGFAVYSFEGIGVILPIQDITEDKDKYYMVVCITCFFITALYLFFAEYCLYAWYERFTPDQPLITAYLHPNWFTDIVKMLYAVQLIISYTLVIYPANMIVEGYVFKGWPKSRKRQMCKNLSRGLIITSTIVLALAVYNKLESFLSIVGSLTCTPIAFILPTWFHWKKCAHDTKWKIIDGCILALSCFLMVYCTIYAIIAW